MRRVQSACLMQTILFGLKEDLPKSMAAQQVQKDVEAYKMQLKRKHTPYQIVGETLREDGSVLLKIKKQYNAYDYKEYFD